MKRRPFGGRLIVVWLLLAAPVIGAAGAPVAVLPAQSEVVFVARQMGVPIEGRFGRFDLQLAFDPARPAAGVANLSVDIASVSLGAAEFDQELLKPAWLSSTRYPRSSFVSRSFRTIAPDRYEVTGTLTLKGRSREVVVPIALSRSANGDLTWAAGSVAIKRREFGVGEGEWSDVGLVADEVQIRFRFALRGLPAR